MEFPINIQKTSKSKLPEVDLDNIVFGRIFSDHMLIADYAEGQWQGINIMPFQNLSFHPATSVLHYGQSVFEGLKAYKDKDHIPVLFRHEDNWNRMNRSAERMCMPDIPKEIFVDGMKRLISIDRDWIPTSAGSSLYIRPFLIAMDQYVGIKPSDHYRFMIFLSPVNAYYPEPIKVKIEEQYVRAVKGGVGYAKAAGNYGGSLYPASLAQQQGYSQLIWTDALEHRYIEESGTMNIFFKINGTVITPNLDGTILEGITRNSVIQLLQSENVPVEERPITVNEVLEAHENGTLEDVFGTGTAATIAHIKAIGYRDQELELPPVDERKLSNHILNRLNKIKKREENDPFDWVETIEG